MVSFGDNKGNDVLCDIHAVKLRFGASAKLPERSQCVSA